MSGTIVSRPARKHSCSPGWTAGDPVDGVPKLGGGVFAIPPSAHDYPRGTVWQCECGQTWVSAGPVALNSPGIIDFRPERRGERRRRERQAKP